VKHGVPGEKAYEREQYREWTTGTGHHSWWSHASRGLQEARSAANKDVPRLLKSRLLGSGTVARGSVSPEKFVFEHPSGRGTHIATGSSLQIRWKGGKPVPVLRRTELYGDVSASIFTGKYVNHKAIKRKPVTVPLDGRRDKMLRRAGIRMSTGELSAALQREQQLQTGARGILGRHRPDALTMPRGPARQGGKRWLGKMRSRVKGFFTRGGR
jgi:hypothetical protein